MGGLNIFRRKASGFTFEQLKDDELEPCLDMILKIKGVKALNREVLRRSLKGPNTLTLVGKSGGKIMGVISGFVPQTFFPSMPPRIVFSFVPDRESSRKGLPAMLINEFVNEVKKHLPKASYIDVSLVSTDPSIVLYSLNGFVISGFIKGDKGAGDLVFLRRSVRGKPKRTFIA